MKGTNEKAENGTIIHDYLAMMYSDASPEGALAEIARKYGKVGGQALQDFNRLVDFEDMPKLDNPIPEFAFAYDPATGKGRELGRMMSRDYSGASPTEFPGTTDLIGIAQDGVLEVWDWKTGTTEIPSPQFNWQLRVAALAIYDIFKPPRLQIGLGHLADGWEPEAYEVDIEKDLPAWRSELQKLQEELLEAIERKEAAAIKTGPHCKYCPAWNSCPAQTGLIKKLALDPQQFVQDINSLLTPETAGLAANRYLQVKELMRLMEGAFRSYVENNGPIKLGGNQVLGPVTVQREELDGKVTYEAIAERFGEEYAKKAVDYSTSKAAVERALKDYEFPPRMKGKTMSEFFSVLRENGGTVKKDREEFRVHYQAEEKSE